MFVFKEIIFLYPEQIRPLEAKFCVLPMECLGSVIEI